MTVKASASLVKTRSLQAKIWGVYYGLKLAVNLSFSRVLELDSAVVISWFFDELQHNHPC